jgi:hypothetical protein
MATPSDPFADFRPLLPKLREWVNQTVAAHAPAAKSPVSAGFKRLPLYFPGQVGERLLKNAKFVEVATLPMPPLAEWGLQEFAWHEQMGGTGITYENTYFVTPDAARDESIHLHELVHVVQWNVLGFEAFVLVYAAGLRTCGYRDNILEVMAFDHQARFLSDHAPYDVGTATWRQLGLLFGKKPSG